MNADDRRAARQARFAQWAAGVRAKLDQTHRLAASGYDPGRGALFVRCACGWEDLVHRDPGWYDSSLLAAEVEQLERFRWHVGGGRA